ncbi:MAG: complex I subunit 5 family protein, partial [Peptococcaceae bacterium]|nr:complex I subunit 5 family protein [Peptococcaceae bacterium]
MTGDIGLLFFILWPMAAAGIGCGLGRRDRRAGDYFAVCAALAELAAAVRLLYIARRSGALVFAWRDLGGLGISLRLAGPGGVYCAIAAFMWWLSLTMSRDYFRHYRHHGRYYFFTLFTLGALAGVFLAADLGTAYIFFEIMSLSSFVMVIHNEDPAAIEAAYLYLFVALICGLAMLLGIQLLGGVTGTLDFAELRVVCGAMPERGRLLLPGLLILAGFGAKAGMFPLHVWLPEAHPAAPAPASALLSGALTKSGVLGVLALTVNVFDGVSAWGLPLLALGAVTAALGAVLALGALDLKRALAYSSVSQIGFILMGAGLLSLPGGESALTLRGAFLHMINHSLAKLALFLAAGAMY